MLSRTRGIHPHSPKRVRLPRALSPATSVFALLLSTSLASAQTDLDPPLPNVMLLVDSSGSMENKTDGSHPSCYPDGSQPSQKSRWIDLVEVLTGTIQGYRCQAVNRSSAAFLSDYDSNGAQAGRPADYLYEEHPYHRPMSGKCVALPGTLDPANAYAFPDTAIRYRDYDASMGTCTFNQAQDGILDSYGNQVRFGLMTFDTATNAQTGVTGNTMNYAAGMDGTWSYNFGNATVANPAYCTDAPIPFDVGARNAAAPPWEGRMVAFGHPSPGNLEYQTKRAQIEKILLATRPYGATPIAGLLHDARNFFLHDDRDDPLNPSQDFGPRSDPWVNDTSIQEPSDDPDGGTTTRVIHGCREQSIILLTDGRPNLDMRPFCEGGNGGICPFDKPEDIAAALVGGDNPIDTFVVPFALSTFTLNGNTRDCNDLDESDFDETDPTSVCGNPANANNDALQACCVLNRIAVAGARPDKTAYYPDGRPRAFFAEDREQLASALSSVLASTMNVTSRTQPVIAGASAGSTGMRFFSLVQPRPLRPWKGVLRRQRWTCNGDGEPEAVDVAVSDGDDLGENIESDPASRRFITIRGGNGSEPIVSTRSMRPYYQPSGDTDGAGIYDAARTVSVPSSFPAAVNPQAMNIVNGTCEGLDAAACRNRYLRWLIGEDNGTDYSRCPSASAPDCSLLGDVLHSTPRVVGPPSDLLRDETYLAFAAARRTRPIVLYTSTNDGFLHAFRVGTLDPEADTEQERGLTLANNELWAFIPPAILPDIRRQYPFNHQLLLDGAPVVKDVVATQEDADDVDAIRFERLQADAIAGANSDATWRTVLVQGFGPMRGGYFALDVTDPEIDAGNLNNVARGPRFLWQLTTDGASNALFGPKGATPAIATLYFDPLGGDDPREIAVALLPGGSTDLGTVGDGDGCPEPAGTNFGTIPFTNLVQPRSRVRCYAGQDVHARSFTIVRLDTGEVIRTFRKDRDEVINADLRDRVTEQDIDSPISGQPVPFPAETGAVSDRAYVGDQDGRLWRVDLSSTDPADWRMELFFDAFPASIDGETKHDFDDGQPIVHPPVVSVDTNGDVTLNFATGNQEVLGSAPGTSNYIWSITERLESNRMTITRRVNWYKEFEDGERVVGPLSLFNSQVFFTTYRPAADGGQACRSGDSLVWGMDYLRPLGFFDTTPGNLAINQGGDPRLPDPNYPNDPERYLQSMTAAMATGDADAVIFGVSVAQQPTCSDTESATADEFLGYGQQHLIQNVNPGKFELVMHKGGTSPAAEEGSIDDNVATLPLNPPPSASRVESWAALIE